MKSTLFTAVVLAAATAMAAPAYAQRGGRSSGGRGGHVASGPGRVVGRAVPRARAGGRAVVPSGRAYATGRTYRPSRSYGAYGRYRTPYRYGYYGPRSTFSFYYGLGYPYYSPFGYYGYGYPYAGYGYPYAAYPYSYAYPGYYGGSPYAYGAPVAYGSVRITEAPEDAQVLVDGYYVGVVDDFDGVFQRLELEPGAHRIEIRAPGYAPLIFDVNVQPGQTINYRAHLRAAQP